MENYQMNRSGCRPYNRTCGMMNPSSVPCPSHCQESDCCIPSRTASNIHKQPSDPPKCTCSSHLEGNIYAPLKQLNPTMAYVPYQNFTSAYDLDYALSVGTIFPQLCKPFCGKRGGQR